MIYETFFSLASTDPQAPAVIEGASGEQLTRSALLARAEELIIGLTSRGLQPRDAVAVQLPNSAEFVAAILAASRLDLVIVPLDRDAPSSEVGRLLEHFSVRALIRRDGLNASMEVIAREARNAPSLPGNSRLVKLTSGSTGLPRGVVTTEENLAADSRNICRSMQIAPADLNLGAIPFSHSYGFANLVLPLLLQGTAVVASNDYLPQALIDLTNRHGCTVAPLIPMVFAHLITTAHGQFETVRTFISAGAPLPAPTSSAFRERFGKDIHSFYGCSEAGGITYDRHGAAVERGTVGEPMDGVIVSAEGNRLSVSSGAVAIGYLIDAATFEPLPHGTFTTDDLVEFRAGGEVALTGRSSDLINTAGKKVNPREVETVIMQLDGVREVKVYGEAAGARGEVVAAAVVASPEVTAERIREHCRAHLSLHKVPRIVKLIERIPVDERGKVKRKALEAI
jgi:long-chain acyl-CoA synthetase